MHHQLFSSSLFYRQHYSVQYTFFPTLELLSRYRHFIEKSDYVFYTNKFAFDVALPLYQFLVRPIKNKTCFS